MSKRQKRDAVVTPAGMSPEQELMRDEMEQQSAALAAQNPPSHDLDHSIVSGGKREVIRDHEGPVTLSDALDAIIGPQSTISQYAAFQREVPARALSLIHDNLDMELGMAQWQQIQRVIELALMQGFNTPR